MGIAHHNIYRYNQKNLPLSPDGRQLQYSEKTMKGKNTMNISPQRLKELEAISEDAIDTSDIPELDDSFWSKAKMVAPRTIAIPNEQ